MITQQQLDEAILGEMGRPDWDIIRAYLAQQAIVMRDSCADAPSWEEVQRRKGFAEGLAYVVNLREHTENAMQAEA